MRLEWTAQARLSCKTSNHTDGSVGLWDTVSAILAKDARAEQLCRNQDPVTVHNMLFENYAKSQIGLDDACRVADVFSTMDTMRSGNIRSLCAEAWQLAYGLPVKIAVSTQNITYTREVRSTNQFVEFSQSI